ncbi:protein methyltransferase RmtC [Talaromyces stipitatus ATCC 10500]|uniref:Protein arginine N-methyltransferase n=1 Tax=Talaromyces stipitatus (strain ATCC 10500 / CBS 375.48 / QM 6759 / NRRL 1006) TaxID=441959 RepID=B8LY42_TALSN|nr:protein methyltransferase RmtC [Talaromyces stipitatus ATCC 10500]EED23287.1 protein methyltransferase RmtC [Talaromyces stipitatus ATCC 10500]
METVPETEDMIHSFCIGQHESNRQVPLSTRSIQFAHASNYDMLTTPITNSHFHSRVLSLLSSHLSSLEPPSYDSIGTRATSLNTKAVTVPPLSPADTPLTPNEAISQVVGITSSWIDLCSPDPLIAEISRQVLMLEVAYAAFCGISYLLVPGPKLQHGNLHCEGLIYYARAIQEALTIAPYIQFHIWLKMIEISGLETTEMGDLSPFARTEFLDPSEDRSAKIDLFGAWDAWEIIRTTCKHHSRLLVALALPKLLPILQVQTRWYSEPVHLLTINATTFIKNQKGYPVLSKAHQALIAKFMRLRTPPWILLCDVGPIPGLEADDVSQTGEAPVDKTDYPTIAQTMAQARKHHDPTPHLSYMRNLQQRQPPRTPIERFGTGYQDYLQAPLQPLTVNLESITYEVFEKDPIKYAWYERAVAKALSDWMEQKKPTSGPDGKVVVAVVGAGRGPLVTRALRASAETGVKIEMWVVEKNPNAFVLLQHHNENIWGGAVNLVKSDMRSWKGPHREIENSADPQNQGSVDHTPIDILISELLGSFGDNELSPECLDGVTHLLSPGHGISIPASYSAHLTPIAAPKLYADICGQRISNPAAPETPYVVMLHAIDYLSTTSSPGGGQAASHTTQLSSSVTSTHSAVGARSSTLTPPPVFEAPTPIVLPAWSFSHHNPNIPPLSTTSSMITNEHNVRQTRLAFPCQNRGVCHGLAGYFETVLYSDIELSTNPVTMDAKSPGMISWFPIYFPLKTPLYVPDNGEVVVTMYRQTDNRKVWYEWMVEVFRLERTSPTPAATSPQRSTTPVMMSGGNRAVPVASSGTTNKTQNGYQRIRVGMSEMHSSIKDGCLM